ncbi:MAG: nicotinate (nicotinamide) nucleotide adenylyltransferase [Lachnospiraceae bacterium]|nr:nicotinate (nicotinamide) nucleotide adenylyltransferase [Lachnospiraceae bacterium]
MAKIGILGGTFHPIHNGHLYIAKQAMKAFDFDELWIMPAGIPPHKRLSGDISRFERLEMCQAAVSEMKGVRVISDEIFQTTKSYTYETLQRFHARYPENSFYFIIGEDSLDSFAHWVHPEIIASLATIVVAVRSQHSIDDPVFLQKLRDTENAFHGKFEAIPTEFMDISSTRLRELLSEGKSIKEFIPEGAWRYIQEHRLYEATMEANDTLRKQIQKDLKAQLKHSRYEHTLGVTYTACALAMRYNYPLTEARFAGLLHDWGKFLSDEEQLHFCRKHHIPVTEAEEKAPYLLHAKIGAYVAEHTYNITSKDVLHAILVHTTGCPNMNLLDKILFTADYIEPNRKEAPRLEDIRAMAFADLDMAVLMILEDSIAYIEQSNRPMDPTTLETYEYYKTYLAERGRK